MCMVLDNCTTNNAMVKDLLQKLLVENTLLASDSLFHIRCSAHNINFIVQERIESIKDVISKVQDTVKYIKSSTLRLKLSSKWLVM